MQQNTLASVILSPAPITVTISPMTTPFSTWLDCLSPFAHCLLYVTILESTTAYQAFHALPYFSANDTLIQLAILFWIYSTLCILFTRTTWCLTSAPNPFQTAAAQESPTILALEQCLLEAWELTLNLLYIEGFNYAISLLPSPILNVVLSSIILLLSESERSTFYTDHPLPTGLPWAYRAATTFSNSFLTINITGSSLTNRDDPIPGSSPQRVDSDTTLIPTVPSTLIIPSTPAIVPPSRLPSPRSPPISCTLHQQGTIIFTARLASTSTTSNICSTLGATPKWHPPPPINSVEPISIPALAPSSTGQDDWPHSPWIISPIITIPPGPSDSGTVCYNWYFLFDELSTFSWVHLILSWHMIILSQGTLSLYLFSHEISISPMLS